MQTFLALLQVYKRNIWGQVLLSVIHKFYYNGSYLLRLGVSW